MDAEPPKVVVASSACESAGDVELAFQRALAVGRAPRAGWTVRSRVAKTRSDVTGRAEVTDDGGRLIAERRVDGAECVAVVRALGVWATLVLDAEMDRAADAPAGERAADPATPAPVAHAPDDLAARSPEVDDANMIELGATGFLLGGAGAGAVMGPSVFAQVGLKSYGGIAWSVRPGAAVGSGIETRYTTEGRSITTTMGVAQIDGCGRMVGNYLDRRGMQFELCLGADAGAVSFGEGSPTGGGSPARGTVPIVSLRPGFGLRGELGSLLAVHVRGAAGFNVVRPEVTDPGGQALRPSSFTTRGEVGLSWRLR